jgi:hypothetical protein
MTFHKGEASMWVIKIVLKAFAFFIVPVVILTFYDNFEGIRNSRATSVEVLRVYGPFYVVVGLFYVAFGIFLWSPLPVRLFKLLLSRGGIPTS